MASDTDGWSLLKQKQEMYHSPFYPPTFIPLLLSFPLCCYGYAIPMATAVLCGWPPAPILEDILNLSLHILFKLNLKTVWALFILLPSHFLCDPLILIWHVGFKPPSTHMLRHTAIKSNSCYVPCSPEW